MFRPQMKTKARAARLESTHVDPRWPRDCCIQFFLTDPQCRKLLEVLDCCIERFGLFPQPVLLGPHELSEDALLVSKNMSLRQKDWSMQDLASGL